MIILISSKKTFLYSERASGIFIPFPISVLDLTTFVEALEIYLIRLDGIKKIFLWNYKMAVQILKF